LEDDDNQRDSVFEALIRTAVRMDLRFRDHALEEEYRRDHVLRFSRTAGRTIAIGAAVWAFFSLLDPARGAHSVELTRFRFMVAVPVLLGFSASAFTAWFRRWPNLTLLALIICANLLLTAQGVIIGEESPFYLAAGSSALNFALILVFSVGLFPSSFGWSCVNGIVLLVLYYAGVRALTTIDPQDLNIFTFNLIIIFAIMMFMGYRRERSARLEFARQTAQEQERDKLSNFLSSYIPLTMVSGEAAKSAEAFGEVTLLFSDLVGFTTLTEQLAPRHVVEILDSIFTQFDEVADQLGVEKVKTIGDAYMAIAGKSADGANHAKVMVDFALKTIEIVRRVAVETGYPLAIRVGIHTGSTIGGVIGRSKMIYDYWGRTVNLASRLETHGEPNRVHLSEATYWRVRDFFKFEERQAIEVRGFGTMRSFFVVGESDRIVR
jgi:adenylate cyclase